MNQFLRKPIKTSETVLFPRYFPALNGGTGFLCGLLLLCVGVGGAWFWFWFCSGAHDQPAAVPPHNWVREHLIQDGSTKISSPPCHPWIRLTCSGRLQASKKSIKKVFTTFSSGALWGSGLAQRAASPSDKPQDFAPMKVSFFTQPAISPNLCKNLDLG